MKGQRRKGQGWSISVVRGPKELRGVKLNVTGPIIVGRSPGADIVIGTSFVSGRHCRFSLLGESLMVEDLGSTNGTLLNGAPILSPIPVKNGDVVSIGNVDIKANRI